MARIEKTVFISYRRTNQPWALAIFQYLTAHGYDVFFDYTSINSGDFEQIILANIRARAHFIVILTPSALERCAEPGDWLRREIEFALENKRNIVPLMLEGFDFGNPSIAGHLTGKLAVLKNYNALDVPASYFEAAMDRLCTRFLNVPLDAVLHPVSATVQRAVSVQKQAAAGAAPVESRQLTAQEWFEKGYKASDPDEKIRCYTEAIRLKPDDADAYLNRGSARYEKGDLDGAIKDYDQAIRLRPDFSEAYTGLGIVRKAKGDLDGAIQAHSESIRLRPDYVVAYNNRAVAHREKGDLEEAIKDYTEALRLKSDFTSAYFNRALAWEQRGDDYAALADYEDCLKYGGGARKQAAEKAVQRLKQKLGRK